MSNPTPQVVVVLSLVKDVPGLVAQANSIAASLQTNAALFASPTPSPQAIIDAANDLAAAHTLALTRAKGAVKNRKVKESALRKILKQSRGYVQVVCDGIGDPEKAIAAAYSAGMSELVHGAHIKALIKITQSAQQGVAALEAKAAPRNARAFYEWRYSLDGGKSWIQTSPTNTADTTISGLPANTVVAFQYRFTVKNTPTDWSQTVTAFIR